MRKIERGLAIVTQIASKLPDTASNSGTTGEAGTPSDTERHLGLLEAVGASNQRAEALWCQVLVVAGQLQSLVSVKLTILGNWRDGPTLIRKLEKMTRKLRVIHQFHPLLAINPSTKAGAETLSDIKWHLGLLEAVGASGRRAETLWW